MAKTKLNNKQRMIKDKMKIDPAQTTNIIVKFIQRQFKKRKKSKAIIGLSGGVDSAVVLALTIKAVGAENIIAVKMPHSRVTPLKNMDDADTLAKNFGVLEKNIHNIDITKEVDNIAKKHRGTTIKRLGNVMARIRMIHLCDFFSEFEGLVMGTGNKSEIVLGYFTRYGDEASDMRPIGGLYKMHIYQLARYLEIPKIIINKPPSANLWPGQTDENEIGYSYDFIDVLLYLLYDKKIPRNRLIKQFQYRKMDIEAIESWAEKNEYKNKPTPVCGIKL